MKKAFTMIEVIFVITVIGIIASVAIPKLNATREDTKISTIITNARIMITDLQDYYTSQGNPRWIVAKIDEVTAIPLYTDVTCTSSVTASTEATAGTFYICDEPGPGAINVVTFQTTDDGHLTVTTKAGSTIADAVSVDKAMIGLANAATVGKTHILGGINVNR